MRVLGGIVGFSEGSLGGNTSGLRRGGPSAGADGLSVRAVGHLWLYKQRLSSILSVGLLDKIF
jgi:hypothetical protein